MNSNSFHQIRRVLSLALALGVFAGSSAAQTTRARGIELAYRWVQGDSSRYRVTEDMVQEVSGEFSSTLEWHREFTYTERVIEADPETGAATIERVVDGLSIEVKGDGIESARYDSNDPQTDASKSNPMIAPFVKMQGQTIRFSIDSEGRVTGVEGAVDMWGAILEGFAGTALGDALQGLSGGAGGSGGTGGGVPSAEAMRRQIEAGMRLIPGRAVKVRESWEQRLPHATPIGTMTSEMEHTLKGIQRSRGGSGGKLARIETSGTLTAGDSVEEMGGGALAGLMALAGIEVNLGETSIQGQTMFDLEGGQIVHQEMTVSTEWSTMVKGLEEFAGEGHQRMMQRSVLERID